MCGPDLERGLTLRLVGLALASIAIACSPRPLLPDGTESEATAATETNAETETGADEPASICAAFELGEPFWADYFGSCWAASEQGCADAIPRSGSGSCHAVYARRLQCEDDGTTCRWAEPKFMECQDPHECLESSATFLCTVHDAGYIRVHELVEPACPIYGTYECTPPEGFDITDYDLCEGP